MSIPSAKAVEIGDAERISGASGRLAHDVISVEAGRITRETNRAGGIEGGVTNGEPLVLRVTHKPLPTQRAPLPTVDIDSGERRPGRYVRSDVGVVPAAAVVAEAVAGLVLADAVLETFGGDRFEDMRDALARHRERVGSPLGKPAGEAP
jgi:chorismate synthase